MVRVARRILTVLPVLFGVSVAVFLMIRLVPGDVVDVLLGTEGVASPQRLAELRRLFGLDRPFYAQYADWAGRMVVGDLGTSLRTGRPILPDVLARLPVTIQLTGTAMVISLLLGLPFGVSRPSGDTPRSTRWSGSSGLVGLSMPNFWLATMLVLFVSLFCAASCRPPGTCPPSQDLVGSFRSVLLPALALGVANMAILMRMTRSSVLEVLRQDYVTTARAKGVSERAVIYRHALRNALIPVVTVAGVQVGYLLGGAIIIEQIFALPGIGTLVLNAITQRDYPLLQAAVLFVAFAFPIVNLVIDVLYTYLDPGSAMADSMATRRPGQRRRRPIRPITRRRRRDPGGAGAPAVRWSARCDPRAGLALLRSAVRAFLLAVPDPLEMNPTRLLETAERASTRWAPTSSAGTS